MRKRICMIFESLTDSNGVARAAVAVASLLAESGNFDVDLIPVFRCKYSDKDNLPANVSIHKIFGFYFKGFRKIIDTVPDKLLYRLFIRKKYDVEIGFQYGLYTKIIANSSNNTAKHIAWMHGYDYGLVLKKYYPLMDKVICVSKFNASRLEKELAAIGEVANVECCYNVIDDQQVIKLGQEPIDCKNRDVPLFISVGRFSPEKGYIRLIGCIDALLKMGYDFDFWLIGDGQELATCKQIVNDNGLSEHVKFWGSQSNPHKYTSKADIFVCSSFSEGYSNACTEAIMLGVPVITTDVPGGHEIINDSKAGLVVDNNQDALTQGLKYILDNPNTVNEWKISVAENNYRFSREYRKKHLINTIETL